MNSKYRYFVPLAFFVLLFLIVSVASFYFLPEGILKEVNVDKDVSDNTSFLMNVFSVLTRNVIVVFFFCIGNLVAIRTSRFTVPMGYFGVGLMIIVNGITLGTWSFSARNDGRPSSVIDILMHNFDVVNNAGLVEMLGALFVVIALGGLNYLIIEKCKLLKCKFTSLNPFEWFFACTGIMMIVLGALIEAKALG